MRERSRSTATAASTLPLLPVMGAVTMLTGIGRPSAPSLIAPAPRPSDHPPARRPAPPRPEGLAQVPRQRRIGGEDLFQGPSLDAPRRLARQRLRRRVPENDPERLVP